MDVLFGMHPVEEALRAGGRRVDHVAVAREGRRDARMESLLSLCREKGVRVTSESREQLARHAKTELHQGVVAFLEERRFLALEDLLRQRPAEGREHRFFLALDGVEDPHNFGALLRSADGAGVDGVVITERRSAPMTAVVAKSSAGASEHARIAKVVNLTRALEQMKREHVWIVGLDERGTQSYEEFDFRQDVCLVMGAEGAGLHDLVKRNCDFLLRIPMRGSVSSLNVSVAAGVVMYEAMRQRESGFGVRESKPAKKQKGLGS